MRNEGRVTINLNNGPATNVPKSVGAGRLSPLTARNAPKRRWPTIFYKSWPGQLPTLAI